MAVTFPNLLELVVAWAWPETKLECARIEIREVGALLMMLEVHGTWDHTHAEDKEHSMAL